MSRLFRILAVTAGALAALLLTGPAALAAEPTRAETPTTVKLPAPNLNGKMSVEMAIATRRSHREFKNAPLTLAQAGQILWAAQGITEPSKGLRAAPSARATYPLDLYLVAGRITGLAPGVYRYQPRGHELLRVGDETLAEAIRKAAPQKAILEAPALLVYTSVRERTVEKLADNAPRLVALDVGHAAENVYLQATALGLGTVTAAGFTPETLREAMKLPEGQLPELVQPLGKL